MLKVRELEDNITLHLMFLERLPPDNKSDTVPVSVPEKSVSTTLAIIHPGVAMTTRKHILLSPIYLAKGGLSRGFV